ncbi:general secretion pathway protein GspB [Marinobacter sediminicola]|uniref:general secretion pathway protein GspB n=1 Tax=Marinobacter sediminicola TaxID=3072994 RepID=UPI002811B179|nr:general secretion pathway protein GspB [Marinobacter sp. F26243]
MSYILDALRKSETERRQGKVPDLGQQVQLIHRPKKKRTSSVVWVVLALLVNAGVLAVVFWPKPTVETAQKPSPKQEQALAAITEPAAEKVEPEPAAQAESTQAVVSPPPVLENNPVSEAERQWPAIITPSVRQQREQPEVAESGPKMRVPHLVELPLSFQKSIPDLMFNSHLYSTDPYASRVMINGHYLGQGDAFSGILVEEVTENGVILSKQGRSFRVGIVRDWVSPR